MQSRAIRPVIIALAVATLSQSESGAALLDGSGQVLITKITGPATDPTRERIYQATTRLTTRHTEQGREVESRRIFQDDMPNTLPPARYEIDGQYSATASHQTSFPSKTGETTTSFEFDLSFANKVDTTFGGHLSLEAEADSSRSLPETEELEDTLTEGEVSESVAAVLEHPRNGNIAIGSAEGESLLNSTGVEFVGVAGAEQDRSVEGDAEARFDIWFRLDDPTPIDHFNGRGASGGTSALFSFDHAPIPEPSSFGLLSFGAIFLVWRSPAR